MREKLRIQVWQKLGLLDFTSTLLQLHFDFDSSSNLLRLYFEDVATEIKEFQASLSLIRHIQ